MLVTGSSKIINAENIKNNDSFYIQKIDFLKMSMENKKPDKGLKIELINTIEKIEDNELRENKLEEVNTFIAIINNDYKSNGQRNISLFLVILLLFTVFIGGRSKLNNFVRWSLRDSIKDFIYAKVEQGIDRDKIFINGLDSPYMEMKEVSSVIDVLIEEGIIEYISEDECIVTEGYYNWLLTKI